MKKTDIVNKVKNLNKIPKGSNIAVIMGGMSGEREVSLRSGKNCLNALQEIGYTNAFSIDMDYNIQQVLAEKKPEIAFLALHGTYGEDGYIQQICEDLDIPYTGCKVKASKLCINKEKTKQVLLNQGITCPKSEADGNISFPVFCKPVDQGSSLGAGIANNAKELAVKKAEIAKFSDKKPLIEEYIQGRELTVGVLQLESYTFATDIIEIEVKDGEYDYKNKYTLGALTLTSPANINEELTNKIKDYAIAAFKAASCRGFARIDIILKDNLPYVIEINTIPGMTDTSDLPHQSKTFGIDYNNLVNLMLHSALI